MACRHQRAQMGRALHAGPHGSGHYGPARQTAGSREACRRVSTHEVRVEDSTARHGACLAAILLHLDH